MDTTTQIIALGWTLYAAAGLALILTVTAVYRRRWRRLLVPLLIVLGCVIWAFIIMLRWPGMARVELPAGSTEDELTRNTLDGHYFSFDYWSSWALNFHDQAGDNVYYERAQVSIAEPRPYRLVVSAERLTQSFDELPAVQSRRRDLSGQYEEGSRTVSGQSAVEFWLTAGSFERTIFLVKGGKLYVASLTSPTAGSDGEQIFTDYVDSLVIK